MSSDQNKYSLPHLIGNVNVPRDVNPTIRGSIRRADPDANPAPHFTGLSGTTLNLNYSPTGAQAIVFSSDDLDIAIADINAVDASNLEAIDDDGYLRLRNLNGGGKNHLTVVSGNAAPLLGFRTSPRPGSSSYAGEVSSAASGRVQSQDNTHGTAAVAGDSDLTTAEFNRAIIGMLQHVERLSNDLDLETLVVKELAVTVETHPISGEKVFRIQDATIRIPIRGFGIATSNPGAADLDPQFQLLEIAGGQSQEFLDLTNATFFGRITNVYYDDLSNALNSGASFTVWGTPDGRSIFNKAATDDKHAATAIVEVDGDVIRATGATFQTLNCSPGDTVFIEAATNNDPFNHNGEFIILEVLGEDELRVRPKSSFDRTFSSADIPRALNSNLPGGTNYGTVAVLIGDFISASTLVFEVEAPTLSNGAHAIRMMVGRRTQEMRLPLADADETSLFKNSVRMAELLRIHSVTAAALRHGADHIDAIAVAGSPDLLTVGTVEEQLAELLGHVNNLIAGQVTYGGGIAWADTAGDTPAGPTLNPSTSLESQVDKMLVDLAGAGVDGAAKIRALANGDLIAGNIRAQLNQLDTEWFKLNRANTISGINTFSARQNFSDTVTFNAQVTYNANILVQNAGRLEIGKGGTDSSTPLLQELGPTVRKLLYRARITATQYLRFYARNDSVGAESFEVTINAVYNDPDWSKDDDSEQSSRLRLSGGGSSTFELHQRFTGAGTWLEAAWAEPISFGLSSLLHTLTGGMDLTGVDTLAQVLRLGNSLLAVEDDQEIPRVKVDRNTVGGSVQKTLVMEMGDSSEGYWRFYVGDDIVARDSFELTFNAYWNTGTQLWNRDNNTNHSTAYVFEDTRFTIRYHPGSESDTWGAINWFDSDFTLEIDINHLQMVDGVLSFIGGSQTNPPATTGIFNRVLAKNQIKAWASITTRVGSPIIGNGFNILSVVTNGNHIDVSFASDMADGDYSIGVSSYFNTNGVVLELENRDVDGFTVKAYFSATGVNINLSNTVGFISLIVCGEQ